MSTPKQSPLKSPRRGEVNDLQVILAASQNRIEDLERELNAAKHRDEINFSQIRVMEKERDQLRTELEAVTKERDEARNYLDTSNTGWEAARKEIDTLWAQLLTAHQMACRAGLERDEANALLEASELKRAFNHQQMEKDAASLTAANAELVEARDKLAAATVICDEAPELNMANYDHEQVRHLNNAMIEMHQVLNATLNHKSP